MYPSPTVPSHVVHHNRGYGYSVAGVSGTIGAALAANSLVFALLCGAQTTLQPSLQLRIYLERLRIAFTTVGAFTGAVSAGRGLGVYRAAGGVGAALPTGGTALAVVKKANLAPASIASACIANAGLLTVGTVVREAAPIAMLDLVGVGAAGGRQEMLYELAAPQNAEIELAPNELLVISNPAAMDAAGTWQLSVDECNWSEQVLSAVT